jgi:hypothetical protein
MDDSPAPRPTQIIVVFSNEKKPMLYPITVICRLASFISLWGIESIRKIIFVFDVTDRTQFPYGIHNLVLQKSKKMKNGFEVQFYHYMDTMNRLVTLPREQQILDFYTVLRLIYENDSLSEIIGKGVIDPFFNTDESGFLC